MRPDNDPTKLVDDWPLPDLSAIHRKKIKAILLKAHAAFHRDPDFNDPYKFIRPMQQAFDGIAGVLFEANLLTVPFMENELREFVIQSGASGGWLNPDQYERVTRVIFEAEIAEWSGKLLEREIEASTSQTQRTIRFRPLDENYRIVELDGRQYDLTSYESTIIRTLHKAHVEKRGSVAIDDILRALRVSSGKMSNWFRGKNKPLKKIILHTGRQHYRLDL